jgi:adenylosuccinate lyase
MFTTDAMLEAVSERSWLVYMLQAEAALRGLPRRKPALIPADAASAISAVCGTEDFDLEDLGKKTAAAAARWCRLSRS